MLNAALNHHTARRILHATLALSALLILSACPKDIPPPSNAIKDYGLLRAASEARVEQFISARFKDVTLDYYGKDERIKVRQLILARPPGDLRIQTKLPGSDELLNVLVSNAQTFAMHQRDTNTFYTGSPSRENINKLLPVDLSAKDVVRVMLGGAPWDRLDRQGGTPAMRWDRQKGLYVVETTSPSGDTLCLELRHTDFALIEVKETNKAGKLVYHYTTDDWKRYEELSLPQYRRFVWPAKQLDFSIDVGQTQVNVDLPDTLFELDPPAGSEIIQVDP